MPIAASQTHFNTLAHSLNLSRNTPCLLEPFAQSFSAYCRDFNHKAHTWLFQPSITSLQDHKFSTSTSMCSHQLSYSLSRDYGFHCLMDILLFVRSVSQYHAWTTKSHNQTLHPKYTKAFLLLHVVVSCIDLIMDWQWELYYGY